jgi:hypothetical protein
MQTYLLSGSMDHPQALLVGYAVGLFGWLGVSRVHTSLWSKSQSPSFVQPWREVAFALLACGVIMVVGQAYVHGYLFKAQGSLRPLTGAMNQILIFSPVFLLLAIRRQGLDTAWLPVKRIWQRLLVGLSLALLAILAFTATRAGSDSWLTVVPRVYSPKNLSFAVEVFCEDIAIAILFVRFQAAMGALLSIILVALSFVAAHLPTLIALGVPLEQTLFLFLDAGLGVLALAVLPHSQDIWWFWCLHFAMDMMQFDALPE